MRLIDADRLPQLNAEYEELIQNRCYYHRDVIRNAPTVDAIPVWYIIWWYEKKYKLGSTVADDWERGLLKEKISEMYGDFKNEKYLDNKQELVRYAQMVKEVIELYNDWERKNENDRCR